ncbi:E3 ubiquitin-protein ligase NEURL3 isoform X2 [Orcinus orca]|uniref:E3 ubiquitin-protein ligase NEURL3 isoform X2 n=3 Tax=Delphinidae TaxID=9726 RepID=UPI0021117C03|nr:E3 ubiquitin-protein ligase NEURL3 isoform X2 [Orcinus orca]XP_049552254.1 E3 ubiquitin-protein ligase NEURL3 isoform X2 [Orcinus orca]XP_049552255.1 E3 ubiquitin-protein ligase NEURL3 isoform X2 [Orcinus orca]XP_049552256.1 E3 ubiquitin-protein ligase NEURL3 isoform X2 [Orcinus orca]
MTRGPAESFGNLSTGLLQTQAPVSEDPRLMGAQICSQADAEMPREALRFHAEAVGAQVRLDAQRSTARRRATFRDGIVFSQRPVRPGERVELRVLCHECGWVGGLRVGFTRLDPERVTASGLPPFVCPDLEQQSPTWAAMLPDGCGLTGDVVRFWVNRLGRLFAQVNAGPRLLLRKDVLMGAPLWAVMDVYGTTKAIELLDPTVSAPTPAMPWVLSDEALPESKVLEAGSPRSERCGQSLVWTWFLACRLQHLQNLTVRERETERELLFL